MSPHFLHSNVARILLLRCLTNSPDVKHPVGVSTRMRSFYLSVSDPPPGGGMKTLSSSSVSKQSRQELCRSSLNNSSVPPRRIEKQNLAHTHTQKARFEGGFYSAAFEVKRFHIQWKIEQVHGVCLKDKFKFLLSKRLRLKEPRGLHYCLV